MTLLEHDLSIRTIDFSKNGSRVSTLLQNLVLSWGYELPFGKGKRFFRQRRRSHEPLCRRLAVERHPSLCLRHSDRRIWRRWCHSAIEWGNRPTVCWACRHAPTSRAVILIRAPSRRHPELDISGAGGCRSARPGAGSGSALLAQQELEAIGKLFVDDNERCRRSSWRSAMACPPSILWDACAVENGI